MDQMIGTHRDYDQIDVTEVNHEKRAEAHSERGGLRSGSRRGRASMGREKSGTPDGDRLDVLATLVDAYEAEHYPMDQPDPLEAIKFRIEQ